MQWHNLLASAVWSIA